MSTFIKMTSILLVALIGTGCTMFDPYYGDGYYGAQQQEQGAVAAISQHEAALKAVMSPTLMPPQSGNCDTLDHGITYAGTNSRYDVQSSGGQTCKGGPSRRAGVVRPPGPAGATFEECREINFSIPECGKYRRE